MRRPSTRASARCVFEVWVLLAVVLTSASLAVAQDRATLTQDIQTDVDGHRSDSLTVDDLGHTLRSRGSFRARQLLPQKARLLGPEALARAEAEAKPPFELSLATPFTYTSKTLGASRARQEDAHFAPSVKLLGMAEAGAFVVSALGGVKSDRYLEHDGSDFDQLDFTLKTAATWGDGYDASVFFAYSPLLKFAPDFAERTLAFNDLSAGMTMKHVPAEFGERLTIDVEVNTGYRFADPATFQSWSFTVRPKLTYKFHERWSGVLDTTVTSRWYDERVRGQDRKDTSLLVTALIVWAPQWLTERPGFKKARVVGQFSFLKNYSTVPAAAFSQFDVGPAMQVKWVW